MSDLHLVLAGHQLANRFLADHPWHFPGYMLAVALVVLGLAWWFR